MKPSVFLSVLAMDSYNQGFNPGIDLRLSKLGTATLRPVEILFADQASGFSASAYDWDNRTVISYRGTDREPFGEAAADILGGWSMFTGFGSNSQAEAARTFYKNATGADFLDSAVEVLPNAIITGHSLGGGLAGFVAARAGVEAFVIDPLPFGALAWQSTISDAFQATVTDLELSDITGIAQVIVEAIANGVIGGSSVTWSSFAERFSHNIRLRSPDLSQVIGASIEGEIASLIPSLQGPLSLALVGTGALLETSVLSALGSFLASAGTSSLSQFALEEMLGDRSKIRSISNYNVGLDANQLHSASLAATILFGEEQWKDEGGSQDWVSSAKYIFPLLNSEKIANYVGISLLGKASLGEKMATVIAYSIINEGDAAARPFGDTAVRALFNDADDLGGLVKNYAVSLPRSFNDDVLTAVGALSVQFAGLLASNQKMTAADSNVLAGVLGFGVGIGSSTNSFTIDLRERTWAAAGRGSASIGGKEDLINTFILADPSGYGGLGKIVDWYRHEEGGELINDVDFVSVSLRPGNVFISEASENVQLSIGTDSNESFTLTSGNDFTMGLGGFDILFGGGGNDILLGGEGEDTLDGGDDADWLEGGAGVDYVIGGKGGDTVRGGAGDDHLYNGANDGSDDGESDTLVGGAGVDTYYVGAGDRIAADGNRAIEPGEKIYFRGKLLIGGERTSASNDPNGTYFDKSGTTFGLSGVNLSVTQGGGGFRSGGASARAVGGSFEIEDFRNGDAGIRLRTKRPDDDEARRTRDPIILDLDLDRRAVTALADSTAYFDLDNDGFRERVAWADSGDGFLVLDRNANGVVDDGSELFGTGARDLVGNVGPFNGQDGFNELALLDVNRDHVIDSKDTDYGRLQVWVDANSDGLTDNGELHSLAELGIASISLRTYVPQNIEMPTDHSLIQSASRATLTDGSTLGVYDAYLAIDNYDTIERNPVPVSEGVRALPFLIGRGSLSDLDVAMTRDPALAEMVSSFASLSVEHASDVYALVERIILRWTGADTVAADSRGPDGDARMLAALEAISGNAFVQLGIGGNPRSDAASILARDWHRIVGETTVELLGQTALGEELLPGLRFKAAAFLVANDGTTLSTVIDAATAAAPSDGQARLSYWRGIVSALGASTGALSVDEATLWDALDEALITNGVGVTARELSRSLYVGSASGSDTAILGTKASDLLIGDAAAVNLAGNQGDDRYVITRNVQHASIRDRSGHDVLELRDWRREDTVTSLNVIEREEVAGTVARISVAVTLTNAGRTVSFVIETGTSGTDMSVDVVTFANGETVPLADLLADSSATGLRFGAMRPLYDIVGTSAGEILIGRGPSDRFHLGSGGGSDVIIDERTGGLETDELLIDAAPQDVEFIITGGARQDLTVRLRNETASVLVVGQWLNETSGIERFVFADGTTLSTSAIRQRLNTGTALDERLEGSYLDDVIDGAGGNDLLAGGGGDDRYIVRGGYGQQSIVDGLGETTVEFSGDIELSDLSLAVVDGALTITVNGSSTAVNVAAGVGSTLIAASGETVAAKDLLVRQAQRAGTTVNGTIYGTTGDDFLEGSAASDLLDPGMGTDYVSGGEGNDTYLFSGGNKTFFDTGFGYDTVLIGGAARLEDVILTRIGGYGSLRVRIAGMTGRIDLANGFDYRTGETDTSSGDDIERLLFSDGRSIDLTTGRRLAGSAGADVLFSFAGGDGTFTPGAGDDLIFSNGYNTVELSEGYGHDVLQSTYPAILNFKGIAFDESVGFIRVGYDLKILTGSDSLLLKGAFTPLASDPIYSITFADRQIGLQEIISRLSISTNGDDLLFGTSLLDGGAGNDVLIGGQGTHTFVFGRGYGHDTIKMQDSTSGQGRRDDELTLVGLNRSDVRFARSADDPMSIVMTIIDTSETLTFDGSPFDGFIKSLEDSLGDGYDNGDQSGAHWIERIIFSDGSTLTQRDVEQIILDAEGTDGSDVLSNFGAPSSNFGYQSGAVLDGGKGNDRYVNVFNDVTVRLKSGGGHDVLDGLDNGQAARVYVDLSGVRPEDVLVRFEERDDRPYTVLYLQDGTELAVEHPKDGIDRHVIYVRADGAQYAEFQAGEEGGLAPNLVDTDGRDFLTGRVEQGGSEGASYTGRFDEAFRPGKGNDVVAGRGGLDTVSFALGDGADELLAMPNDAFGGGPLPSLARSPGASRAFGVTGITGYRIAFADGIGLADLGFEWLTDGSGRVRLTVGEEGDSITAKATDLVDATFADGTTVSFRRGPVGSIELSSSSYVESGPTDEAFFAPDGGLNLVFGPSSGHDRLIDGYLSDFDGAAQPPMGWSPSVLQLQGASSFDDFDFIRDIDAPANLIVVNRSTGASIVIEGQFAAEGANADAWQPIPRNDSGQFDWSKLDFNRDGVSDVAPLDLDGDGSPDWTRSGGADGVSWLLQRSETIDVDGDGTVDHGRFDTDGDGVLDGFILNQGYEGQIGGTYVFFRDIDGDGIPDQASADGQSYSTIARNPDGSTNWAAVDFDGNGVSDSAVLDVNKDGVPEWLTPDLDGNGRSDWVDRSRDILVGVDNLIVATRFRGSDGIMNWSMPNVFTGRGTLTLRDTDGDGVPEELAFDIDGDGTGDPEPTPRTVGDFVLQLTDQDGTTSFEQLGWSGIVGRVRSAAMSSGRVPTPRVDLTPPLVSNGSDIIVVDDYSPFGIDALGGDDKIFARKHAISLVFGVGSGNDVLIGRPERYNGSTVQLKGVESVDGLEFLRGVDDDLVVRVVETGESLTIRGQFARSTAFATPVVHQFIFGNGRSLSWQEALGYVVGVSSEGESDQSTGTAGGVLDGGAGSDVLRGGTGDDIYRFGRGYAEDVIQDAGGNDTIIFGEGISPDDVFFSRAGAVGADLLVEVTGSDRLAATVAGQFGTENGRVETFLFSNGTSLGWRDVQRRILDVASTSANDTILGFATADRIIGRSGNDVLSGLGGDDVLDGGEGRDTAVFAGRRADYDVLTENGATTVRDLIAGRDGTDRLVSIEDIRFLGDATDAPIVPVNQAPTSSVPNLAVREDKDLVVTRAALLAQAQDLDGDAITLTDVTSASNGRVWFDLDGNVRFRPTADFSGQAGFQYIIADGNGGRTVVNAIVAVEAVNDRPIATAGIPAVIVDEDRLVDVELPHDIFRDVESSTLSISFGTAGGGELPTWLSVSNGRLTGLPPADYNGTVVLEMRASDGQATTAVPFELVVRSIDDAPRIVQRVGDRLVQPGKDIIVPISAGIIDPDGDPVVLTVSLADGGALPIWLRLEAGQLIGRVPDDFAGPLNIAVSASDGRGRATDLFVMRGGDVDTSPTIGRTLADVVFDEDSNIELSIPAGTFVDVDGDTLVLTASLAGGQELPSWLSFDGQRLTGQPPAHFSGSINVAVTASDGRKSVTDEFSITIAPVNDTPTTTGPVFDQRVQEDQSFTYTVPASLFADVDGDALTLSAGMANGSALPAWLTFNAASRTFSGTPGNGDVGIIELLITATDPAGAAASADFSIAVANVNDAPTVAGGIADQVAKEDATFSVVIPAGLFEDVDSGDVLSVAITFDELSSLPSWLHYDVSSRTLSGTPANENVGTHSISVTATDSSGSLISTNFVLNVANVNDAPIVDRGLATVFLVEDSALDFQVPTSVFKDVDGDGLTISATLSDRTALPSWLTFDGTRLRGTPPIDFNGALFIQLTADDGQAIATTEFKLAVLPANDAPVVAEMIADVSVSAGSPITISVPSSKFKDVDGDVLTISAALDDGRPLPSWLTFANGTLTGVAPTGHAGVYEVRITADDGHVSIFDSFNLSITASGENGAPVSSMPLSDKSLYRNEAFDIAIPVGAFSDVDGDTLTYVATRADGSPLPTWLTFSNGRFTGIVPSDALGNESIRVVASDGKAATSSVFQISASIRTGAPLVAAQWDMIGEGNDRVTGGGAANDSINGAGGDDWLTGDNWNLSLTGGTGNDVLELLSDDNWATGSEGVDYFILDGFSLTRTSSYGTQWATITDFQAGVDKIGLVNGTAGIRSFAELQPFMTQDGSDVSIRLKGLPQVTVQGATLATMTASDFWFGSYDTDGGFGLKPIDGFVPWPNTTETLVFGSSEINENSERIIGNGATNTTVLARDGDDWITVDGYNVSVFAGRGNDIIELAGTDAYAEGGPGYDYYVFDSSKLEFADFNTNWARLGGFHNGVDKIVFLNGTGDLQAFADLSGLMTQSGDHVIIALSGLPAITIEDTKLTDLDESDFLFVAQNSELKAGMADETLRIGTTVGLSKISANGFSKVTVSGTNTHNMLDFSHVELNGIAAIDGKDGDDVIVGSSAADTIIGGAGADSLSGGLGDDVLLGGADSDTLEGGEGNDLFKVFGSTDGYDAIDGGTGIDTIAAQSSNTAIGLKALTGVEVITAGSYAGVYLRGSDGADLLDFSATSLVGIARIDGGSGNDVIVGSSANDIIQGSAGDDALSGGAGNDIFQYSGSAAGNDFVNGGAGNDTILALANSTVIRLAGMTSVEAISGGSFSGVTVAGSSSGDVLDFGSVTLTAIAKIDGGTGDDTITGNASANVIAGGEGNDRLFGGAGNDNLTGDAGDDIMTGGLGNDIMNGGAGIDWVDYSDYTAAITVNLATTGAQTVATGESDTITNTENLRGGSGNDVLTGNSGANILEGGLGNDTLNGGAGNDLLVAGSGADVIDGGTGIDTVDYSAFSANLSVSLSITSAQTVASGDTDAISNVENLMGGAGNDVLTGNTFSNTIQGGAGTDRISGGSGDDLISGGAGSDVAVFAGTMTTYSVVTSSGSIQITDNAISQDGNDGSDTLTGIEMAEFKNAVQIGFAAPVLLDLDGNGIGTSSITSSSAFYDFNGDGIGDKTSWFAKGDGMLFMDRDGNGSVSGAGEFSFINDLPGARSDLEGLRAFDSDNDGILSDTDASYASFKVWADDGDGAVSENEVLSLSQAGIASISLRSDHVNGSSALGDVVTLANGKFNYVDGTEGRLADAILTYTPANIRASTEALEYSEPKSTPNRSGYRSWHGPEQVQLFEDGSIFDSSVSNSDVGNNDISVSETIEITGALQERERSVTTYPSPLTSLRSGMYDFSHGFLEVSINGEMSVSGASEAEKPETVRTLAMMRQDVASFGGRSGEGDMSWRAGAMIQVTEFFA